ncbi:MAG: dTDP-glucose 4,6-dehydratase, partial [Vulcanimicrobiota bacterium]
MQSLLITGGAGFIGSHVVRHFLQTQAGRYRVVNLDSLTYAGNLENLTDISGTPNYVFKHGDINDRELVSALFEEFDFDGVIHLAAESHVDRSIDSPGQFVETNVMGTVCLLDMARSHWKEHSEGRCFCHVSTDEVYGSLGEHGSFSEDTPYDPRSPYSASKAAADHLVRAYHHTYGLPVKITNCSNNYGSHQFPEKLIPLCISRILDHQPIPVYGDGLNVRDWLYVEDHARAISTVFHSG